MKKSNSLLFWCVIGTIAIANNATGQTTLTLDEAIIRVLENHPSLQVRDYEARAIAARMRQARLAPADRLNVSLEDFAGTGNVSGVSGIEATLRLTRTLELGNKAVLRGDAVEYEAQLLDNQIDIDRLDLMAETARRFVHVVADQERLRIAEQAIDLVALTAATVEERISAGRTPAAERQRVAIDLANYELDLDHKRHEMDSSRVNLVSLWRERQPTFEQAEADFFELDELADFDDLDALLERNPDLILYSRAEDLARARIRVADSKRQPDITVTPGLRYFSDGDDIGFLVAAEIPLGSSDRARPAIDEAESLALIEPLNFEHKKLELYAALFELFQELKHAYDAYEMLTETVIPAAEEMLGAYDSGYQSGRYSLIELIEAQELLLDSRAEAVEHASNYHMFNIEIDRLTGARPVQ